MDDDRKYKDGSSPDSRNVTPLTGALERVIERLRAPPLLFALGVLIVLAIVAALSVQALALLWLPALALAVIALLVWLIPLLRKGRGRRAGTRVRLRAEDVGKTGTVKGIEGLPVDRDSDIDVEMAVKRVKGRTVGVSASRHDAGERDDA